MNPISRSRLLVGAFYLLAALSLLKLPAVFDPVRFRGLWRLGNRLNLSPLSPVFHSDLYIQHPSFRLDYEDGSQRDYRFEELLPLLYRNRLVAVSFWHAVKYNSQFPPTIYLDVLRKVICTPDRDGARLITPFERARSGTFFRNEKDREGVRFSCEEMAR